MVGMESHHDGAEIEEAHVLEGPIIFAAPVSVEASPEVENLAASPQPKWCISSSPDTVDSSTTQDSDQVIDSKEVLCIISVRNGFIVRYRFSHQCSKCTIPPRPPQNFTSGCIPEHGRIPPQ
jgi:hypothetical protein